MKYASIGGVAVVNDGNGASDEAEEYDGCGHEFEQPSPL
jgi:hypothetical protein